ncbi:hypothetical protein ACIGQE_07470 [Streptomyces sp. NPDC053429]|uniref:hypothetical protein n=1 Tax=Streptomyces sp. NPDC053429 TaxID=3365702 RepID=UPI0037D07C5B
MAHGPAARTVALDARRRHRDQADRLGFCFSPLRPASELINRARPPAGRPRLGRDHLAFAPFHSIAGPGRTAGATGGARVLAIPGTGDRRHLDANVAAGALRLTDDDLAALDSVHRS